MPLETTDAYNNNNNNNNNNIEQSYPWLKFGDIKGETESTIVAAIVLPSN